MSTPNSSYPTSNYVRPDIIVPIEPEESAEILTDYLRTVAYAINDKDIGQYPLVEIVNGQKWPSNTADNVNKMRNAFRKVIDFGALPDTTAKTAPHGITTNINTTFTRIFATATDPGASTTTSAIPIPFADPAAAANSIRLEVDATNVTITTAIDYSAYSRCYVVLEWLQN